MKVKVFQVFLAACFTLGTSPAGWAQGPGGANDSDANTGTLPPPDAGQNNNRPPGRARFNAGNTNAQGDNSGPPPGFRRFRAAQGQNQGAGQGAGQGPNQGQGLGQGFRQGGQGGGRGGGQGLTDEQRAARRQRMMERFDTNHDGVLDDKEREAMHQFRQQQRARWAGQQGQPPGAGGPGPGGQRPGGGASNSTPDN
jgi:hypothetical protein